MIIRIFLILSLVTSSLLALQRVKIGILAKRSADITLKKYSATADYLTREVEGYRFEIVPLGFEELGQSVAKGKIDFLLTNTAYYVDLEHLYGVSRIVTLENKSYDGTRVSSFGGVILSRADADIQTPEDLKGKKFAAVNLNSFGGWIMAQKELLDHGIKRDDFAQLEFLCSHDSVVLAVINGEVDAGTVRTGILEQMIDEKVIKPNTFKILAKKQYRSFPFRVSTALYPEWPFAKLSHTSHELADAVAIALLKMPSSSKAAKDSHIYGWTIPLDYSKVNRLLEELNLSFYANLKEVTVEEFYEKYKAWFWVISTIFVIILLFLIYIYRLNNNLRKSKAQIKKLNAIKEQSMLKDMELERIANYEETILAFVNIIEQRDSYTAGHTLRVARYSCLIAEEMGIEPNEISKLEKAAILHDIGKIVTPDAILLKPDRLTPLEYELITQHSLAGYEMLSKIEMYKDLAVIIKYHHIHYDGSGYPEMDDDISQKTLLLSYILSAADAFDAMTSNRIYKIRKTIPEAIKEITNQSGEQFHPRVTQAVSRVLKDITLEDTSQLPVTEFEERRFAYFFRDALTDAYNENYLHIVLNYQEDDKRCFNLIKLKKFTEYNHKFGWDSGNNILKTFSSNLQRDYPDAMIFRHHGDDFILLFHQHKRITQESLLAYEIFENGELSIEIKHYNLKDGLPAI